MGNKKYKLLSVFFSSLKKGTEQINAVLRALVEEEFNGNDSKIAKEANMGISSDDTALTISTVHIPIEKGVM